MGFYYLSALELHPLITRVGTRGVLLSQRYEFIPHQLSVATIILEFPRVSMLRVVSLIETYIYA